jgi:helicase, putative, recD/traA family|nr:MAG TPA: ATP dependent DNA helicase [Ackermannviridae sp.]DAW82248.1 MAG TPA: ATP dependent DNA helicase [Bacteriophage sp.]
MAITKKDMGQDAFRWCNFLKAEFKITDSIALSIWSKYIKLKLLENGMLNKNIFPSREYDYLWFKTFRDDLDNFVKNVKGIGLQNYLRIVNGFNFDYFTITTFNVLIDDFISNGTEGSTILPFSKFFKYVIEVTDDYKKQYDRTVVDKLTKENILKKIRESDVLLLDVNCKVLDTSLEDYAEKVEFITSREAYWIEKTLFKYLKLLEKEKYDFVTKENIDYVLKKSKAKLNEKQSQFVYNFAQSGLNCLIGVGGCLPVGTEILTEQGWLNIENWNGQKIMEIDIDYTKNIKNQTFNGVFRQPKDYIVKEIDQFYQLKSNTMDLIVSENHNNIHISSKGSINYLYTWELLEKEKNIQKTGNIINIPEIFTFNNHNKLHYTNDYIRLKVAVFADGSFSSNVKSRPNLCAINIKKDRKKKRLEQLLEANGIEYKIHKSSEGYSKYVFDMDNKDKHFDYTWYLYSSNEQKEIILDELKYWDGSLGIGNRLFRYSSTHKIDVDIIQLIAHSLGYRARIEIDTRVGRTTTYSLNFSKTKYGVKCLDINKNRPKSYIKKVDAGKYMYCFTTHSGNFLIRQKNQIYITGNSGKSFTSKIAIDSMVRSGYEVVLLTPTGISAKVLTNFTGRQAYTIHRYFMAMGGVGSSEVVDLDNYEEQTNNVNELVYYFDESGMYSIVHFKFICNNILIPAMNRRERFLLENPDATKEEIPKLPKLVFVGDTNQLAPISSGCFFRDILDLIKVGSLKANLTELTEIMRAKSDTYIPYICNKFCIDYSPMEDSMYLNEEPNVLMIPLSEELETGDALAKFIYEYMVEMNNANPNIPYTFENTTIMLPQKVGDKGTKNINDILDSLYKKDNPKAKTIGMVTKNNYDLMVFNGDRFRLENKEAYEEHTYKDKETGQKKTQIIYKYTISMLDDDRIVEFTDGEVNWELAYCSTVHKLQGCTSENVIFVASRTHTFMLTKQLVYTALSRASKTLTVLYDRFTFENARKRDTKYKRKTFLGEIVKLKKGGRL